MDIDSNARYAGEIASRAGESFDSFSELPKSKRYIPKIHWDDIHIEKLLGEGRFSAVYLVTVKPHENYHPVINDVVQEDVDYNEERQENENNNNNGSNGNNNDNKINILNSNNMKDSKDNSDNYINKLDYNRHYALKVLRSESMSDRNSFRATAVDMVRESKLLSCLEHPNIIKLYALRSGQVSQSFRGNGFFMLLEPLSSVLDKRMRIWRKLKEEQEANKKGIVGNLLAPMLGKNRGNKSKRNLKESKEQKQESSPTNNKPQQYNILHDGNYLPTLLERIQYVALGIANGMEYLHANSVIFRDLKPENVGFDTASQNVRIFDFGISKELLPKDKDRKLTGRTGTIRYMAPENALCKEYGLPVDVYSFGILLWELCSLKRSFESMTVEQFKSKVHAENSTFRPYLSGPTKDGKKLAKALSPELKGLISNCWDYNPNKRPTFNVVVTTLQKELSSTYYTYGY